MPVFLANLCSLCNAFKLKMFYKCLLLLNFVVGVILGFLEFLFQPGGKTLTSSGCKIISIVISTTTFVEFQSSNISNRQKKVLIEMSAYFKLNHMVYFCSGLTEILELFLPEKSERLSCPFSKQGIMCIKMHESRSYWEHLYT